MMTSKRTIRATLLVLLGLASAATAGSPPAGSRVLLDESGDLSAWRMEKKDEPVRWTFADGALEVVPKSGSIITRDPVQDFQLHLEFKVPDNGRQGQANGNSGVYIQQRYEVQILNSYGQEPLKDGCGAIYKIKAPDANASRPAGEWQTYDITFHSPRWDAQGRKSAAARITVIHNDTKIHDNVDIPAKTGAGQREGPEPGPILLQDHGNPVQFRNIWIRSLEDG
jgi:hypothetical protein